MGKGDNSMMTWTHMWQILFPVTHRGVTLPGVTALALLLSSSLADAWDPPLGIPRPSFGITELAPQIPDPWTADRVGFYYVQSGGGNNDNGYPGNPRGKIPSTLPAGSVVILSGRYTAYHGGKCSITANGTQNNPVYIRGISKTQQPVITQGWEVCGSYYVIEDIKAEWANAVGEGRLFLFGDHGVVRHTDFRGDTGKGIGGVFLKGNNHVIWDNYFHDFGDVHATTDQDNHCIGMSDGTNTVWVVDNELARCSGDGVQLNGSSNDQLHHIYIGRNKSHHHKQTGLWTKKASDVIFSQNSCYGLRPSGSSPGAAMGYQYGPSMVWFLANRLYDSEEGFTGASSNGPGGNIYFVNNIVYDISTTATIDVKSPWHPGQAFLLWGEGNLFFVNNTIYNTQGGIGLPYRNPVFVANNIFASLQGNAPALLMDPASFSGNSVQNNVFQSGIQVQIGGSNYTTSQFQTAFPGKVVNNGEFDPGFVNAPGRDFHLKATSPAINAGIKASVYQTFVDRYGIDIAKDIEQVARPQGSAYDVGAYEAGTNSEVPPASPTALLIQ